eukprot:TRINITY_DN4679_c0_g1_i11.p1 TRINITY_DN4679_c0_g1~~TRINITY_DN4679_c0_g1_i11.p1  ORF type:complete len:354 (+),score=81.71 TRINITY_DN4679_c0_g1_i11:44-1063(+)
MAASGAPGGGGPHSGLLIFARLLEVGVEGVIHLKLNVSALSAFDSAGIMEYTEAAGVPEQVRQVDNSQLAIRSESYYWDLGWNELVEGDRKRWRGLPKPRKGDVITLRACIRPGGHLSLTAHDGSTASVPILFQRGNGTSSRDSKFAFFVTVNNPDGGVEIVDEGSGNPPFDVAGRQNVISDSDSDESQQPQPAASSAAPQAPADAEPDESDGGGRPPEPDESDGGGRPPEPDESDGGGCSPIARADAPSSPADGGGRPPEPGESDGGGRPPSPRADTCSPAADPAGGGPLPDAQQRSDHTPSSQPVQQGGNGPTDPARRGGDRAPTGEAKGGRCCVVL